MRKLFLVIFILASIGVVVTELATLNTVYLICKPLIMVSLIAFYFASVSSSERSRTLILAMAFSGAGDILLMDGNLFIAGLVSFLLAHVFYIFTYRQHQGEETKNALVGLQRVRLAFPVVLAATGLVIILFPVLGDLKIPVIVYAGVLAFMVLTALFRFGKTSLESFWMVFAGAVLFMASDSVLAVNRFLQPIANAGLWIMTTYCLAQLLIVRGLIRHPQTELSEA